MAAVLNASVHVFLVLFLSPLLLGVINKTKALVAGRVGPPLLQVYFDLAKLFRKGMVFSRTTTWVFRAGPWVGWVSVLAASLMVPLGHHRAPLAFQGDMIFMVYLLALGRFFTASAALDTGSSFEGMGAAREVSFSSFAEPALFFGFLALVRLSQTYSLSDMVLGENFKVGPEKIASLILITVAWFIVLLAENSRIPFDDPNTHLELTMVHEVMVLDHSGPALGLILHGASMKLLLMGALVMDIALPWDLSGFADWPAFILEMGLLAVLVGVVESFMARLRLKLVPNLLVSACLLSAFGFILLVR
jgi:formate hydrogenlyase subunit 4